MTSTRPRVLHVLGSLDVGGAEIRTLELYRQIHRDVDFEFATLSGRRGELAEQFETLGGVVHPCRVRSPGFPAAFLKLLRSRRPTCVHSHVATFSGVLLLTARAAGVPQRVAHFRSDGDGRADFWRRRVQRGVMRRLIRACATDIVGVSPGALSAGYRRDWQSDPRAQVIVNGIPASRSAGPPVDLRAHLGLDAGATVLIHVGRPSLEKNRAFTVRVLRALVDAGLDAHLVLVGGRGADAALVDPVVAELGVHDRVHEAGRVPNPLSLVGGADLSVLTSVREGLPGVVLESLSVGTPALTSELAGASFIADHLPGISSCSLDQAPSGWAVRAEELLERYGSPTGRDELRGAFAASQFTQDRSIEGYRALYGVERTSGRGVVP